jgi:integrase
MSRDTGCRPHELLKLRIKEVVFKTIGNRQYAEVLVNGKTGSRSIPLIDSIPYVKDYINHEHPQSANPNAIFLYGNRRADHMRLNSVCVQAHVPRYLIFHWSLRNPRQSKSSH